MQYSKQTSISTETKVAVGILALTAAIIAGGLMLFKGSAASSGLTEETVMKNIDTGLTLAKTKVAPAINPKITGTGLGTATSSTSTAPIEITEFMDYECPACAYQGEVITQKLLELYGSRITITRRIFPVHGEPAIMVARMVLASQDVSKEAYMALHAKVFETQSTWSAFGTKDREAFFRKMTADLGLNYDNLVAVGDSKYANQIDADKSDALDLGIKATPSFIVNYKTRITGGVPVEYFMRYVDVR